ncbi:MAG: hypothetical protein IK002_03260 [Treponema sp.]|uniref:hypothetical protein n=1 Tax=Treponema sp. TaxID=166 RepID=UPI00298D9B59|nr:hypothetical protein [Treponema sp.]MBR5932985.1 hypothetical protein [Treponema sp.]
MKQKDEPNGGLRIIILIAITCIILVMLIVNMIRNNKNMQILMEECNEIKEKVLVNSEKLDGLKSDLIGLETKIDNGFLIIEGQNVELLEHAVKSQGTANRQYRKTLEIEKTYSDLLKEERKTRIDSSEFDLSIEAKKKEARKCFDKAQYSDALKNYREILEVNSFDNEVRLYKMLSLFYINKMDSTNYSEILNDIKILKENAITDERIYEIEKIIKQEKSQE